MAKIFRKKIAKTDRHIRWNWEQSPDDLEKVRYHFIIVDNKRREGTFESIINQFQKFNPIEIVRKVEGKVENSPYRYLFNSFDTQIAPREIDLTKIGLPKVKDSDLYERKIGSVEDYVEKLYS
jgi:hypothetical protein